MKRRAVALGLLWLWFLSPAVSRAEGRAFDFSRPAPRSVHLMEPRSPWVRGLSGGDRIRAVSPASVTVTTTDEGIPAHLWVVPLVLTGAGLVTGITVCAVGSGGSGEGEFCNQSVLGGLLLGAALGLGYLYLAACADSEEGCSEPCDEDTEYCDEDEAVKGSMRRAALRDARRKAMHGMSRGTRSLPLGLSPTVGFVNDKAVFGLGGHF
ncbi:hypothetical protein JY651_43690 [Pyxidicoccus parkwayensis]|uniref:Lipoprotein n=1 Tax=Pyxidicoccus parkwayensis TaxID=2813578 RepID=A0ABX7NSW9_9BACT|nr:hypothetical protein [Pyxidicoccus parkwaysis]QSQ21977.1 hypothetical protein JY651_43690 [Pyxidicoccus parkwaysis]